MRAWLLLLLTPALAGCVDDGWEVPYGVRPVEYATDCPLMYPDNTSWDCDVDGFTPPSDVPGLASGWSCASQYTDDHDNVYSRYEHEDGRYGMRFTGPGFEDEGVTIARLLVNTEDQGYAAVAPHQEDLFIALEEPVPDEIHDIYLTLREFRAFIIPPGSDEAQLAGPDEAQVIVGRWNGIDWYAWKLSLPGGTAYIDMMRPDSDDDEFLQWGFDRGEYMLPDGTVVITDLKGAGIKYLKQGEATPTDTINEVLRFCRTT